MKEVQRYFDSEAATYLARSERGLWAWQRHRESRAIAELMGSVNGLEVLDAGCGAGYYTRALLKHGAARVTAIDCSKRMLMELPHDDRVVSIHSDSAQFSIPTRFPMQVCAGLLEFVDSPFDVLDNLRRHAATSGRLVCLVPLDNPFGRLYRSFHRRHGITINLFSLNHMTELAASCGWALRGDAFVFPFGLVVRLDTDAAG